MTSMTVCFMHVTLTDHDSELLLYYLLYQFENK